jgi:hypothetical protein
MMPRLAWNSLAIFAEQQALPPTLESARQSLVETPWMLALAVFAAVASVAYWWWLYRRDAASLSPGYGWLLFGLRLGVLVALGLYFARFEQRVDRREQFDSRAVVLVDTSLSMARVDADLQSTAGTQARWELVAAQLESGGLIDRLREKHDLFIYTFDEKDKPALAATFDKAGSTATDSSGDSQSGELSADSTYWQIATTFEALSQATPEVLWWILGGVLVAAFVLGVVWLTRSGRVREMSAVDWFWSLLGTVAPAAGVLALILLAYSQRDAVEETAGGTIVPATEAEMPKSNEPAVPPLREQLRPKGSATRLGDALKSVLAEQRSHPVSGIVVFTDGGQNAGDAPLAVVADAKGASIPIQVVGLGSDRRRSSVRISDFAAPARVFPDDGFDVTATVQASNLKDRTVSLSLYTTTAGPKDNAAAAKGTETLVATERVTLGNDGEAKPVKFTLPPLPVGTHHYVARLEKLADDDDARDNEAQAAVEVVAQQMRVLLVASGPSRGYQYARNLFFRDKTISVDVWLGTAPPGPGISQDADAILGEFPRTRQDLDKYDAVIAFDPDWSQFDAAQVAALVEWVDRQLGGLVVVAGPIHTVELTTDNNASQTLSQIRALYPVTFARRGVALASDAEKFRSTTPWRVELTRDGLEAPFLRLEDDAAANAAVWETFEGVFGYFPVQGAKPGARIYAHYGTPDATKGPPVYMAGQFYGAGRVIYLGSGETWRLRAIEETYFDRFWTKLARFVAEGRLLRGSRRGAILVDNRRVTLGERVEVRAMLRTADREPLAVDRVAMQLSQPDGAVQTVTLLPDGTTPGIYRTDFVAAQQGVYRLELEAPGTPYELVAETIRVLEPDLEAEHARRDDALLSAIATGTGGKYLIGAGGPAAYGTTSAIVGELRDATRYLRVRGAASAEWDRLWAMTLLGVICGLLFTEWTLRRLAKLA